MFFRTVLCSVCVFTATLTAADRVVLKNGDTLTGTVVKKVGDKLTLKSEFLGEVTMPLVRRAELPVPGDAHRDPA